MDGKQGNSSDCKDAGRKISPIPPVIFKTQSTTINRSEDTTEFRNYSKIRTNFKKLCKNFSSESRSKKSLCDVFASCEKIDIANEDISGKRQVITNATDVQNHNYKSNCESLSKASSKATILNMKMEKQQEDCEQDEEFNSIESWGDVDEPTDILSKSGFSSNVFKNIPVRQRKGQVSHMENYCLFDPADFCNENKTRKNFEAKPSGRFNFEPQIFCNFDVPAKEVEDICELGEKNCSLVHHNYYEIDAEQLEHDNQLNQQTQSLLRILSARISQDHTFRKSSRQYIFVRTSDRRLPHISEKYFADLLPRPSCRVN